jgi:uncharacterized protein (DUF1697 family)
MKRLRESCESAGFTNVSTYINSGNVILSSHLLAGDLQERIEAQIRQDFNCNVPVVIRTREQLLATLSALPTDWENDKNQKTDILFLWDTVDAPESIAELKPVKGVDALIYTPGAITWNIKRENYSKSAMQNFIGTKIYKKMTARNINTLRKLVDLMKIS